ncbi:MAG: Nucleotide-diphospho-sugar transferase [Rhodobacteraceae bacterium HLUCCO07]|nr:MAG: Nucleotide-diphospho-sugar transferase [Rhodobacteraceae bacterium HLUCCO07]
MKAMDKGVIYVATGHDYRDLALQSARSLRQVEPGLPIDLFTDAPDAVPRDLFDAVHPIENPHRRSKLDCMRQTRFERTLYLDCDTLVTAPLGDLFDLLGRFEMALAHDVRRASDLIREGLDHSTPYAFPQMNSGVVLYRRDKRVMDFLRDWARRFAEAGVVRDQVVLKDMLWQGDLAFYVLPPEFNLRRLTVLDAWEPEDAIPTILHSHRLMDHMRGSGTRITQVDKLIEAERAALGEEWAGRKGGDDALTRLLNPRANR